MSWAINYSKEALKFLSINKLSEEELDNDFVKVIKKLKGENINIDIKKMKGEWVGYYRLRERKMRIIFSIDFDEQIIYVDRIDYRGNIYK